VSALTLEAMFVLLGSLLRLLVSSPNLRDIALENLALRQQLTVFKRKCPRPRLRRTDRFFWVWLSRSWKDWHRVLIIVRPETVVVWHRKGFRLFWSWISRRKSGRPEASPAVRALILKMAAANPLWGAPRIHGELLKLGIHISERTVSRLVPGELLICDTTLAIPDFVTMMKSAIWSFFSFISSPRSPGSWVPAACVPWWRSRSSSSSNS